MPTNQRKFDRAVTLQIGDREYGEGLRINFKVKKTVTKSLNKATITAYNLPKSFVSEIQETDTFIQLSAGYQSNPTLIFRGNPVEDGVSTTRQEGEFEVELECSDGLKEYQSARVNVSVSEQTDARDVLQRVLDQTSWTEGTIDVPDNFRLTQGVVLHDSARKVLDRLAASQNADWSVQDGQLNFVPQGETTERGPLFTPKANNVLDLSKKEKGRIQLKTFLEPINPGSRFKVEDTDGFNGTYKVRSVTHEGDSGYDNPFYTTIVTEAP